MTQNPSRAANRLTLAATGVLGVATAGLALAAYRLTIRHGASLLQIEDLEQLSVMNQADEDAHPHSALYRYGAPPGSVAMNFDLPTTSGDNLTLTRFKGRRVLLVFVAPDCPVSIELLPLLERARAACTDDRVEIMIVSSGSVSENRDLMDSLGVTLPVVVQTGNEVSMLHYVSGTPMGYLLNADGVTETQRLDGPLAILGGALILSQVLSTCPNRPSRQPIWT